LIDHDRTEVEVLDMNVFRPLHLLQFAQKNPPEGHVAHIGIADARNKSHTFRRERTIELTWGETSRTQRKINRASFKEKLFRPHVQ